MISVLRIAALALLMGVSWSQLAFAEKVRFGTAAEPYPPFTMPNASGSWVGWEIDLMNAVCAEAKLDCELTPISWDGLIPALMVGKIDVIVAGMTITDERKKTIDFSDKYINNPIGIIGLKEQKFDATPEGLVGKVIGVQIATTSEAYIKKHFGENIAELKTYQTQDEVNQDLAAGRIDALQAEVTVVEPFLKTDQGKACCDFKGYIGEDPAVLGFGTGFGLRKGDDELKQKLNAAIKAIRANGVYDRFTSKYFDYKVYTD